MPEEDLHLSDQTQPQTYCHWHPASVASLVDSPLHESFPSRVLDNCDSPGLSDTGESQIMVPNGGPKDEPDEGRGAVETTAVYGGV